jgi:hypothetical protein
MTRILTTDMRHLLSLCLWALLLLIGLFAFVASVQAARSNSASPWLPEQNHPR